MVRKISIISLLLIFAVAFSISAQTSDSTRTTSNNTSHHDSVSFAAQPEHQKKIYVDQTDSTIYWPLNAPVYIWLSPTPEKEGKSYLLQNVTKTTQDNNTSDANNAIKLEISGNQFLRWYNYVTKDTIKFKFVADGNTPDATLIFADVSKYTTDENIYYGSGLKCEIRATDMLSGTKDIYFSVNGSEFELFRDSIYFEEERKYHLRFYAVDWVGNAGFPKEKMFMVDLSPPETTHDILGDHSNDVLSPDATIRLISDDKLSGVSKVYYKFDHQDAFITYSDQAITVDHLEDGKHKLIYYATDHVNNIENKKEFSFYLDKKAPVLAHKILGDQYDTGDSLFISERSKIELSSEDNKIGRKIIEYCVQSESFKQYTNPFSLPKKNGKYSIAFKATDNLGNTSDVKTIDIFMDLTSPSTDFEFIGPHYHQRGRYWINRDTKISFISMDQESGLREIIYKINRSPQKVYSKPFTLEDEGEYEIKYWGKDHVSNSETKRRMYVTVDNTPPDIIVNFSVASINSTNGGNGKESNVYPPNTSIFLGSTDASVSSEGIWYSINGEPEKEYKAPITFQQEGAYKIDIRTKDKVENEAKKAISFFIEE